MGEGRRGHGGAEHDAKIRRRRAVLRYGEVGDRQKRRARFVGREPECRGGALLPYLEEFRIPDQSDDMVGGLRAAGRQLHLECLPDGIGVLEIPSCERLVHDGRLRRVGPVSTVERPSREERRPHHTKVVAADFVEVRVAVLHRTARDDASVPITAVERHDQCLSGVANAGDLLEARDDGGEGLPPRLGPHRGSAQVDRHHHYVGIEAQVDRGEVFKVRPKSSAPTTITIESATCTTTSPRRSASASCPSVDDRPPGCMAFATSRRVALSAGLRPNSTHVKNVTVARNANTRQSGVRSRKILLPRALRNSTSVWLIQRASSSPPTAPNPASSTLSDNI